MTLDYLSKDGITDIRDVCRPDSVIGGRGLAEGGCCWQSRCVFVDGGDELRW